MRARILAWTITLGIFFGVPFLLVWVFMPLLDVSHATYLAAQGNYKAALKTLNRAVKFNSGFGPAYTRRGWVFDKLGQQGQAIADFNKAIEINQGSWEPYNNRAMVQTELQQANLRPALDDANKAIELCPDCSAAYDTRGWVQLKQSNADGALSDFNRALELNTRFGEAYYHRSLAFDKLNKPDESKADKMRAHEFGYYGDSIY